MLTIRPATPADVDAAVPLLLASSPDLVAATFGAATTAVVRRDFLRGKGIFGYGFLRVGVVDGRVVATATSYPGRAYRRLSLHTLWSAALVAPARLPGVLRRMLAMAGLFAPPRRDSRFLANLCVAPACRDRGFGSALLADAEARGPVEFDVSYANVRARRLYERLGYVVVDERPAPPGGPLDGFRRMRRLTTRARSSP